MEISKAEFEASPHTVLTFLEPRKPKFRQRLDKIYKRALRVIKESPLQVTHDNSLKGLDKATTV